MEKNAVEQRIDEAPSEFLSYPSFPGCYSGTFLIRWLKFWSSCTCYDVCDLLLPAGRRKGRCHEIHQPVSKTSYCIHRCQSV